MKKRAQIIVSGQVQGVFYRYWTKGQAEELGLSGFARNEPYGTVLIVVEGEEEAIKKLIDRCWNGPDQARVENVQVEWSDYEGRFDGFRVQ